MVFSYYKQQDVRYLRLYLRRKKKQSDQVSLFGDRTDVRDLIISLMVGCGSNGTGNFYTYITNSFLNRYMKVGKTMVKKEFTRHYENLCSVAGIEPNYEEDFKGYKLFPA